MTPTFKRVLAGLWACAGLLSLASCGGGAEPAAQSLPQTIAFSSPGEQRFGTLPAPLLATASSGLPVSLASSTPAVCSVSGTRLALLGVGTCSVIAQQPGDASFAPAASLTSSFGVAMGSQSITFVAPGNQALNTPPAALVASASSSLAVAFASRTPSVCSVTGNALTLLGLGTCTLDASQAGNANFQAAPVASQSFAVASGLLAQSINFAALANQTLGSPAPALAATASSGLAVSFVVTTADICSVAGTALTLRAAGVCTVAASQAGDPQFAAAAAVLINVTVLPTAQSISFSGPGNQTLGSPTPLLVASASSGLPVGFASSSPAVCTTSGSTLVLVGTGSCALLASQAGNANFAAATPVAVSIAVLPAAQTISFAAPVNQTLGSTPAALVASSSAGLTVSLASATPAVCSVSGTTLTLLAAGTCTVMASQAGNASVAAATAVSRSFSVATASQTLSLATPATQTLGSAAPALVASASSGLTVSLASATPAVCGVSGSSLTLLTAGTCSVSASQAGNASFAPAAGVSVSFAVVQASQSISFAGLANQTLGSAPPALVASASSGLAVSLATSTPGVCSVSGSSLTLLAVGTCSISASQAGNAVYGAAAVVLRSFSVAAAPLITQTIIFTSPGNQTLGNPPLALSATSSAGLAVAFASTTTGVCSVSGSTLTLLALGSCSISASQAGNGVYAAATPVAQAITVGAAPLLAQTISFATPADQTLGTLPPALVASASSGLGVSLASITPAVCSVSGSTLTLVAAGTCSINASQTGNSSYAAAPTVTRSFAVVMAAQSISFSAPGTQTMGSTASLVASASSGLAVAFTSNTSAVCSVSGSTLTPVSAGSCTVTASQPGNGVYAAAAAVSQTFTVQLAAQSISFTSPGMQTVGSSTALVASASSGLAVSLASSTPGVCTVSGSSLTLVAVGTCSISASQAGNAVYGAAAVVLRSFSVAAAPLITQTIIFTSPGTQTMGSTASLVASASSGLAVAIVSNTPSVCTVSGATLTSLASGTCTLSASQAGNGSFAAAASVSRSVTVQPAPLLLQSISFGAPATQTAGSSSTLVASASSGLTVAFSSSTQGVCTVSGSSLTLVAAGTCSISASQAGNGVFAAASTVTQSFTSAIEYFANGGFETIGVTTPAFGWLNAAAGYSRSTDARSGGFSAQLASPAFNAAVMLQNSVDQGARPALTVGQSPTLTFWAKGNAGGTGNVLFALRYLDGIGNIKANSGNVFFQGQINATTWTKITYNLGPVPAGASAAFIEFSQGIGPIDATFPAGLVLIDDLSLRLP